LTAKKPSKGFENLISFARIEAIFKGIKNENSKEEFPRSEFNALNPL
jgi:hypothetical protein